MKHTLDANILAEDQFTVIIASGDDARGCRKRLQYIAAFDAPTKGLIYLDYKVTDKLWQNVWAGTDGREAIRRYNEL
jgi:hypothetical protein